MWPKEVLKKEWEAGKESNDIGGTKVKTISVVMSRFNVVNKEEPD